jgi:hypothetical protein
MSKSPVDPVELAEAVLKRLKDKQLVALRNEDGACIECQAIEGHETGCVLRTLETEIENTKSEWAEVTSKIGPAQKEYDRAIGVEYKDKRFDKPLPEDVVKATDKAQSTLFAWMDRKVVLEKQLAKLQSADEVERRRQVNNRIKEIRVASNSKKETAKDQGVPGTYLGPSGNFKPGMDARYKSDLIASILDGKIGPKGLHHFTKESAMERLQQRDWLGHLEKAKKSREAKAAKKEEKAKATPRARSTRATTKKTTTPHKRSTSKKA